MSAYDGTGHRRVGEMVSSASMSSRSAVCAGNTLSRKASARFSVLAISCALPFAGLLILYLESHRSWQAEAATLSLAGFLALLVAVPIGLMGGIASAAYYDLAIRSCPPGLHGTLMMMVDGVFQLAYRGGDLLGSWIYASSPTHGFLYCVLVTAAVYTLILPLILLVPNELIATTDGEPNLANRD